MLSFNGARQISGKSVRMSIRIRKRRSNALLAAQANGRTFLEPRREFKLQQITAAAPTLHERPVKTSSRKTFADAERAFQTGRVANCSQQELEQLLVASAAENIDDPAARERAREMNETMRLLLETRSQPRRSNLAPLAILLAIVALLCSAAQAFYSRAVYLSARDSAAELGDYVRAATRDDWRGDPRMQVTIEELARRAPTLSTGTLQAWWAGEEARRVEALERRAKNQMLEGDFAGALQNVKRADAIRTGIEPLAKFEKPPEE